MCNVSVKEDKSVRARVRVGVRIRVLVWYSRR